LKTEGEKSQRRRRRQEIGRGSEKGGGLNTSREVLAKNHWVGQKGEGKPGGGGRGIRWGGREGKSLHLGAWGHVRKWTVCFQIAKKAEVEGEKDLIRGGKKKSKKWKIRNFSRREVKNRGKGDGKQA